MFSRICRCGVRQCRCTKIGERVRGWAWCVVVLLVVSGGSWGQELSRRPEGPVSPKPVVPPPVAVAKPVVIPLTVPPGTPIKITLDRKFRVRSVGQPVHGTVVEPVYAFDKLLIPKGAAALGKVSEIGQVSKKQRTLSGLNADFSPPRQVHVTFTELVLPDGRHLPVETSVSPASGGVLRFVSAGKKASPTQPGQASTGERKGKVRREIADAREDMKAKWTSLKKQVSGPGKTDRLKAELKTLALSQSPYRPQYMNPGTAFDANLQRPLNFGTEQVDAQKLKTLGNEPPSGCIVHARLTTPLSSATAKRGDPVEAVISQPVIASDHLFFPEGSHLKGTVLQARPARWLSHSGQLRISFHQIVPPNGIEQKIESSLEAVAVTDGEHLALDSEGGAQVTAPKTRYLTTGIAALLATSSVMDRDAGHRTANASGGDVGSGAANGAFGFRLVGTVLGAAAHSRVVSSGLGFYGMSLSLYSHFLARGREVVYPKDMSMLIELGSREPTTAAVPRH